METLLFTLVMIGLTLTLGFSALGVSLLVLAPRPQGARPTGLSGAAPRGRTTLSRLGGGGGTSGLIPTTHTRPRRIGKTKAFSGAQP
jgi:hypothetical protein